MSRQRRTVIWAIDPFQSEAKPSKQAISKFLNWLERVDFDLLPVYVLRTPPEASAQFMSRELPQWISAAEQAASRMINELDVRPALPTQIVIANGDSIDAAVAQLTETVQPFNPPCLVVASRGKSRVENVFLGSFSEALLKSSHAPILFLDHREDARKETLTSEPKLPSIDKIIFPTDFSEPSKHAFTSLLEGIGRVTKEVILLHSVCLPNSPLGAAVWTEFPIPENYFSEQSEWAKAQAVQWIKSAEACGVRCKLVIRDGGISPEIAQTVLEMAQAENADLVAMASSSGPVSSWLVGSVAKEVFRSNQLPIWVYGPNASQPSQAAQ